MISSEVAEGPGAALQPRPDQSTVALAPPGEGAGFWAGAPSAALGDDGIYLAYRLRRPLMAGRGYAVTVARSVDGVRFETLITIRREETGADSLERPGLIRDRSGRWRLYPSTARSSCLRPSIRPSSKSAGAWSCCPAMPRPG